MASSRKLTTTEYITQVVAQFLDNVLATGQRISIAYSGGLDSSVLLDVMVKLQAGNSSVLAAIHFHHGMSQKAGHWASHCQQVCSSYGIPLRLEYLNVPRVSRGGLESAARNCRYNILDEIDSDWIALGHHANDQAETLLLNLVRGAGILGMSAMLPVRGRYLRPLLGIGRQQLLAYAQEEGLTWCEDESNKELRFTRNFIRHEIVSRLAAHIPNVEHRLSLSVSHAANANLLLTDLARIDAEGKELCFPFPIAPFTRLRTDRAANLLRSILSLSGFQCPPNARLLEFVRQLRESKPDRHPELRLGGTLIKYRRGSLEVEIPASKSKDSPEGGQ